MRSTKGASRWQPAHLAKPARPAEKSKLKKNLNPNQGWPWPFSIQALGKSWWWTCMQIMISDFFAVFWSILSPYWCLMTAKIVKNPSCRSCMTSASNMASRASPDGQGMSKMIEHVPRQCLGHCRRSKTAKNGQNLIFLIRAPRGMSVRHRTADSSFSVAKAS